MKSTCSTWNEKNVNEKFFCSSVDPVKPLKGVAWEEGIGGNKAGYGSLLTSLKVIGGHGKWLHFSCLGLWLCNIAHVILGNHNQSIQCGDG